MTSSLPLRILALALTALVASCASSGGTTTDPPGDSGVLDSGGEDAGTDSGGDLDVEGSDAADSDDTSEPRCGDGVVDDGESCDAGELNGSDGEPCTDTCVIDADRDSFSPPEDCDDSDANVNPAADELCNGVDDNCDDLIDNDPVDDPDCGLPAIVRFEASRATVPSGATVSLEWEVSQASSVSIASMPEGLGLGDVAGSGVELVTINETTTFVLAAANEFGTATDEVTVEVVPALAIVTPDSETTELPSGVVDEAFSYTCEAVGGRTPYFWTIEGDLPDGVSIADDSGEIGGTPTEFGEYTFDVVVQDALMDAQVDRRTLTWRVDSSVVTIGSTELADGIVAEPYTETLSAFGGTPPYMWSWSGDTPAGLSLATDGTLSGTPADAGEFSVTVRVEDAGDPSTSDELTLPLVVIEANPVIITEALPDGEVGAPYTTTLEVTGGTAPLTWAITDVPEGLIGDPLLGIISGTPTVEETTDVSIIVTDELGRRDETTLSLTIGPPAPRLIAPTLENALEGQSYAALFEAESGTPPYNFALTGGSVPAGMSLSASGALSGTPTESGVFSLVVEVTDSRGLSDEDGLEFTVDPRLVLEPLSLADGFAAVPYEDTITVTGGVEPLTWSVVGTLPPGTELIESGRTATISGTPTTRGTYSFAVQVRDARVPPQFVTENGLIRIEAAPPEVSEDPLPNARRGSPYAYTVIAVGGTPPYTWGATGLPPGLSMSATTGAISGTPIASGDFTPRITVTDSIARSDDAVLPLVVRPPAPNVSADPLADAVVGIAYTGTLVGTNGTPPFTWELVGGALPDGLTLAPDGTITGTPAAAGSTGFTVELTDSAGETASGAQSITVYEPLTITTTTLPNATRGGDYSTTIGSSGGKSPIAWRIISDTVPGGASIDSATGQLSLNSSSTGTFNILVEATDAVVPAQRVERAFSLTVDASAPIINAASLPGGQELVPYVGATLSATDGTPPLTWSVDGGLFPPGLTLSAAGEISGTPSSEGFYTFTVRVTDALARSSTREFTIDIDPPAILPEHPMVFGAVPDISAFGTEQATISTADDSVSADVPLGFEFEFYGVTYPDVRISTNGAVFFDATSTTTGLPEIPNASSPNAFIAPFSDDLDPGDSGQIFTATLGVAPYRVFVVQWKDVDFFSGSEAKMNFAVALYETTNQVQILHGRNIPGNGTLAGRTAGNSATVGIENTDGSGGVSLVYNEENGVRPGQVWLLTPNVDGSDYTTEEWFALPNAFEDIATTGTELGAIDGDDRSESFTFPFTFNFYGTGYTSVTASSNGYLAFTGSGTSFDNQSFPSSSVGAVVAPLWDDMTAGVSGDSDPRVFWEVRGTAPNRRLIVQWDRFRWLSDSESDLTFQAILHETTNHIEFNYANLRDTLSGFRHRGQSATVGVNAGDGTGGVMSSFNEGVVETGDSVLVIPRNWADNSDYAISGNSARFIDIGVSGTVASSVSSDDSTQTIAIPFSYEHFGTPYASMQVSSNGYVTFGSDGTDFSNDPIGDTLDPDDFLAPFWDDLNPNQGQILTHTVGTAPDRQFIVQWDGVSLLSDSGSRLTFQVVLNESGGAAFNYGPMISTTLPDRVRGSSATIGVENAAGDAGTQLGYDREGVAVAGGFARITNR